MAMSDMYGPSDESESIATIHAAIDAGINLLDTGRAVLAGCAEVDRTAVLGGNANRVYRLGLEMDSRGDS